LAGRTILVVDDNQTNRNVIRGLLEHWQCRVKEAQDGFSALEAIDLDGDIDAALLDMHMPRMDGAELARKIRARSEGRGVPLVLLSSSGLGTGDLDDAGLFSSIIFKPIRSVPLARALAQALEPESEATVKRQETGSDRGELQSLRVLVVEDNSINQIVATEYLNRWGCDVTVAENGEVAIRLTETQRFDAILMDVQMPVLDGFAATRKIREREATSGEHVPIFAMTANAMSGDRERCLQAGMDGYLPKPLQPTVLLKELQAVARPNERIEMAQSETMSDGEVEPQLFDPGRLDESCAGKTSLKLRVIEKYITSSEASLETIEVAASQGDHASLAGGAHALKGSSLTIGSPAVSELCEQVERAAGRREVAQAEIAKLRPTMEALTDRLTSFAEELRAQG
jgi:CheY-like chemotaxis protein/HPt (histidine-containing phosphotransfer) domain-containing protein